MSVINGTPGDDTLRAVAISPETDQFLYGFAGNDKLFGVTQDGTVHMIGGAGNDTYYFYDQDDGGVTTPTAWNVIVEARGGGIDTVYAYAFGTIQLADNVEHLRLIEGKGASGNDLANTIRGNNGANGLHGEGGNDSVWGLGGHDKIYGDAGNDRLYGGAGNDYLWGGAGNDTLSGGAGPDLFIFDRKPDARTNRDTILDFSHAQHDRIHLEGQTSFRGLGHGSLNPAKFHVGAAAHDTSDRIIYNEKTGALFYDADGSASHYKAVQFATLIHHPHLVAADFLVT